MTDGETTFDPDAETDPIPGLIEMLVAPEVVQESVEEPPAVMVVGLAVKVAVGLPGEATLKTYTAFAPA